MNRILHHHRNARRSLTGALLGASLLVSGTALYAQTVEGFAPDRLARIAPAMTEQVAAVFAKYRPA